MTALNFIIQPDRCFLALDTLALSADDASPYSFKTKFITLPHLNTLVTSTGFGPMVESWMYDLNGNILVRDIDHLNAFAPNLIRKLADQCEDIKSNKVTATMYHFGISVNRNEFVAYAYRSTNN